MKKDTNKLPHKSTSPDIDKAHNNARTNLYRYNGDTAENQMLYDEVVGGGHTVPVQYEGMNQFSQFNTVNKICGNTDLDGRDYGDFKPLSQASGDKSSLMYGEKNIKPDYERNKSGGKRDENGDNRDRSGGERDENGDNHDKNGAKSDCGCDENGSQNEKKERDNEEKDGAVAVKDGEKVIKTIVIAGQIEGHTQLPPEQKATRYEELIPQLVEIEESDKISGLLLILNTVGGDVEAGLALSEMIAGMKKPTASLVLGGGHSIGVPLAVAAKRSFIVPSATMTLHPVRVTGMVLSAPQTYVYLNNMQNRIVNFVCSHCNMSSARFNELMLAREEMSTDLGSVLDGKKAVEEGLIDELGTLNDALSFLKLEAQSSDA